MIAGEDIVLAVVGSREYNNYPEFSHYLNSYIHELRINSINVKKIVSGGARGTDKMAELFAKKNNIEIIVLSPNWKRYGRAAGIIRNTDIVGECDYLIAFPTKDSRGTIDSINKAKKLHKNVKIINVN